MLIICRLKVNIAAKKFARSVNIVQEGIFINCGNDGEPDCYRDFYQDGIIRYMQGESVMVVKIDEELKEVTLQNENNDYGNELFTIPKAQFEADFQVLEQ